MDTQELEEMQKMGWGTPKTCRPETAAPGTPSVLATPIPAPATASGLATPSPADAPWIPAAAPVAPAGIPAASVAPAAPSIPAIPPVGIPAAPVAPAAPAPVAPVAPSIPSPEPPMMATPLGSDPHRDRLSKLSVSGLVKEIAMVKKHPYWGQFIKENKVEPLEFGSLDPVEEMVKFYQDAEEVLAKGVSAPATSPAPSPATVAGLPPSGPSQPVAPAPATAPTPVKMEQPVAPAKQQVFGAPPVSPAQAAAAHAIAHQLEKQQKAAKDQEYTRRAAANLIKRLRENPARLQGMQSLKDMVFDEGKKGDLISLLVDNSGSLNKVQCHLQLLQETGNIQVARKVAMRLTKKQMQDMYGDDAEKVMKHKEESGMIEDDENMPDGKVYLVAKREDENEDFERNSILVWLFAYFIHGS